MSALTVQASQHAARPSALRDPRRAERHLVSVPTGTDVPTELRVTRRGRLALTTIAVAALLALGTGIATAGGEATAATTVTVEQGQTLSDVAASQMPGVPTSAAVSAIRSENALSTPFVHAGQELVIPTR